MTGAHMTAPPLLPPSPHTLPFFFPSLPLSFLSLCFHQPFFVSLPPSSAFLSLSFFIPPSFVILFLS